MPTTELDVPDIGDPTLEAEVVRDGVLLTYVLSIGLALFIVWIVAMAVLL